MVGGWPTPSEKYESQWEGLFSYGKMFETTNQYITMVSKWDGNNYIPTIVDGFSPLEKLLYKPHELVCYIYHKPSNPACSFRQLSYAIWRGAPSSSKIRCFCWHGAKLLFYHVQYMVIVLHVIDMVLHVHTIYWLLW